MMRDVVALRAADHDDDIVELYACVVGDTEAASKMPLLIARDLEERFMRDGWPAGRLYGSEADLERRYDAGRDVVREAVRILEARESARMKRGPNGGLEVISPSREHLRNLVGGFAYISGLSAVQIIESWVAIVTIAARLVEPRSLGSFEITVETTGASSLLRRFSADLIAASGHELLRFMADCIDPLLPPAMDMQAIWIEGMCGRILRDLMQGRREIAARRIRLAFGKAERRNLAAASHAGKGGLPTPRECTPPPSPSTWLVQQLMANLSPEEWAQNCLIGNEFDLCERYGVDRSIVRQAIRVMENADVAKTVAGRGRGLVTKRPGSAPLSRQLCTLFASYPPFRSNVDKCVDALMIEQAWLAARKCDSASIAVIDTLCENLASLGEAPAVADLQPIERFQQSLGQNALLALFIDGMKAFLSWKMTDELLVPRWIMGIYVEHTQAVLGAIKNRDATGATALQAKKQETLRQCRQRARAGL